MANSVKTKGIVLKNVKYGDNANIVTLYTKCKGLQSFWFRRKTGKISTNVLLAPLAQVDLVYKVNRNNKIHNPIETSLAVHYNSLYINPLKSSMVLFLTEWLQKVLKEEEQNIELYEFIAENLIEIDRSVSLHSSFHLSFIFHLSRFLGILPNTSGYENGMCFIFEDGTFNYEKPVSGNYADKSISYQLFLLSEVPMIEYSGFKVSKEDRNSLLSLFIHYYATHLPKFGDLKSVSVIQSLFA